MTGDKEITLNSLCEEWFKKNWEYISFTSLMMLISFVFGICSVFILME